MIDTADDLMLPERILCADGSPRRVGVEIEMHGLDIQELAQLTATFIGGNVERLSRYEYVVHGDNAGDWLVELDFSLLKKMGREQRPASEFGSEILDSAEDLLKWVSEPWVPVELVSPPLPLQRLGEVNLLIELLRRAGARGTGDKLTYAFGMQFNPEVPDARADTITAYLKAFLCLYDWILERANIDFTRRLTAYVDPFPESYVRRVVDPCYWPAMPYLIDDYLRYNPTRNRALDMLPLFKYLDAKRVAAVTTNELIKARPTFHYRLPNCLIDEPNWGVHIAWADWLEVEHLAQNRERLDACCSAYGKYLDESLGRLLQRWVKEVEAKWLSTSDHS